MRISDWSSDVCSSDLSSTMTLPQRQGHGAGCPAADQQRVVPRRQRHLTEMVSRPDRRLADCEIAKRAIAKRAIAEGEGRSPTFGGETRGVALEMVDGGKTEGEVPSPGRIGVDVDPAEGPLRRRGV